MGTHMPQFPWHINDLHNFVLAKLATSSIKVKIFIYVSDHE